MGEKRVKIIKEENKRLEYVLYDLMIKTRKISIRLSRFVKMMY
jgi:hypothetical protein